MLAPRRQGWTDDHGADGLRPKFATYKLVDRGAPLPPAKHELDPDEFVFVLRPESDEAAVHALHRYAEAVGRRAPQLARDIRTKLRAIEINNEVD